MKFNKQLKNPPSPARQMAAGGEGERLSKSLILQQFRGRLILILSILIFSCKQEKLPETLFQQKSPKKTGIHFSNDLTPREDFNMYVFKNFYNGGGVGIGDVNNDGLQDIYFTGNQVDNKLYLNQGNFKFEDVTESAGVACKDVWSTGVSMVDVNADGWLDIYVCKSGPPEGANRHNELFINDQDGTFTEKAKQYGLDDLGLSTHAAFFDYDRDGDLDCYLLNNSLRSVGGYDIVKDQRNKRDTLGGNKLYRNDGQTFTDVSEQAGIYGSNIGFGLGVTVGDINNDNWPDFFVSNDFFERDYLYINNQDGTFTEDIENRMGELSFSSMGADMADLNNDGHPEIFVTDMLPESNARQKTKTVFETWDKYQLNLQNGYHRQFPRNVLQLNNGDGTFSEIGRQAGVYATDWSWGALIFDMNSDGKKDIFVANGIGKDLMDLDYVNFYASPQVIRERIQNKEEDVILGLMEDMPSVKLPNYAFIQTEELVFNNQSKELGLGSPSFSNGSAYADLDNDGDLDLVVNNVNETAFVYENTSNPENYIKLKLKGPEGNPFGIGTEITFFTVDSDYHSRYQLSPYSGFQSSVDYNMIIALPESINAADVYINWPNGTNEVLTISPIPQDVTLTIGEYDGFNERSSKKPIFVRRESNNETNEVHDRRTGFFDRNPLAFQYMNTHNEDAGFHIPYNGHQISVNDDINGDGIQDVVSVGYFTGPEITLESETDLRVNHNALKEFSGFWNTIEAIDLNNDGLMDLVCGNNGLNTRIKGDKDHPVRLYTSDFDNNGSIEQILTCYNGDKSYPLVQLKDLVKQIPSLKNKFTHFEDYQDANIQDIFRANQLANASVLEATENRSGVFVNRGNLDFEFVPFPSEAQRFPIYAIAQFDDYLVVHGNQYVAKPEVGIQDAGRGLLLQYDKELNFTAIPQWKSGFNVKGEVRNIEIVETSDTRTQIIFNRKNQGPIVYEKTDYAK